MMKGLFLHLNFRPLRSSPIYKSVNRDVSLISKEQNIYAISDRHKISRNINIYALSMRHCGPHNWHDRLLCTLVCSSESNETPEIDVSQRDVNHTKVLEYEYSSILVR